MRGPPPKHYIGINSVAFYFVRSKALFIYYGEPHGLANKCRVLQSVEAGNVQDALNNLFGVDLGCLALVTSAPNIQSLSPLVKNATIERKGIGLSIFVNANTFPKTDRADRKK
jgi:hypothetical protein